MFHSSGRAARGSRSPAQPESEKIEMGEKTPARRVTKMLPLLLAIPLAAVFASPLASQQQSAPAPSSDAQQPPNQQRPPKITVRADTVIVPVTVKDRQGQLVAGLQREDFRILDDDVEQKIQFFSSEAFPLSAVVLIDNNLSQKQAQQVQKSLEAISGGFGPNDEAAVVVYDQFPETISDFTFNNDQIFASLKHLEIGSHFPGGFGGPISSTPVINGQAQPTGGPPPTAAPINSETKDLDDALWAAGQMLKGRGSDRRKIVFLITDGNNSRHNAHPFNETLQLLLVSDVSVYSISVGHALMQKQTPRLEHYAKATGGDVYFASKDRDLERLYASVTEEARNQYTLTFSPEDVDRSKEYHALEVRVRRPDLNVSTREGYYQGTLHPAPR
jgi:VWFA-related protein